jgi:hypothetical protein
MLDEMCAVCEIHRVDDDLAGVEAAQFLANGGIDQFVVFDGGRGR